MWQHGLVSDFAGADLFPALTALGLSSNHITDGGVGALATVASDGAAPAFAQLEQLSLMCNGIGPAGMGALAFAIGAGAFPAMSACLLRGQTPPADETVVLQALSSPSDQRLRSVRGEEGSIGHAATRRASDAARSDMQLRPPPASSWNVHGCDVDVAASLASSYRVGTLL